ncbi:MAG TPA: alkaline phosphatase family protein [Thermoanaerobaculia bacterium]|nr:alkaline phosphatase family protein [Thermoanaerobaculia bacterium]
MRQPRTSTPLPRRPRTRPQRFGACALSLAALLVAAPAGASEPPRLILQITVDQLRGDLIGRYLERMGDGGFRRLLDTGVVYDDAHHPHANTETIVGHATLATGAYPAAHGMIGNVWLDRATGELTYNIEDSAYPLLTAGADVDRGTEIDPTQKAARSEGRSPRNLLVSTFGDELALHTAGRAKVFAVSVKDRGAVSLAGHAGKAFWFSKATGEFVTSRFYYDRYPAWVEAFNAERPASRYAGTSWELLLDRSRYLLGDRDDQPWETAFGSYGRVFPHPYGPADGKYFTTLLTLSPAGDELTLDFAKRLIESEQVGADEVTDFLAVSFSSTDYVGHLFGPSSLEAEDNLLRLDRTLADLLAFVDARVGLARTLVVLSADHGGPEVPGQLRESGFEADYVDPSSWDTQPGIARLKQRFGIGEELIQRYFHPYVYLDHEVLREHRLDPAEVERAVAEELTQLDGVALAVSSTALVEGRVPDTPLLRAILHNHNPRRSGDVFVVFEPNWFLNDFDGLAVAATHGSPWTYDSFVPLIFAGAGLEPRHVARPVETIDVARTLAAFVGTKPPSAARGEILPEVAASRK